MRDLRRARHLGASSALAALLAACVPEVDAVRLPVSSDAAFVLVVAYGPGTDVRVDVRARPASGPAELSVPLGTEALWAAELGCSFESLGYTVPLVPSAEGVLLPKPRAVHAWQPGDPGQWASVELDGTRLASLRLLGTSTAAGCAELSERATPGEPAEWLVPVSARAVLAGSARSLRVLDDAGGDVELPGLSTPIFGAAAGAAGDVWVMTATGATHLTLADGVQGGLRGVCADSACPVGRVWMDVARGSAAPELIALVDDGRLLRVDAAGATELARASGAVTSGAVVALDDGALVLGLAGERLKRLRGAGVEDVAAPVDRASVLVRARDAEGEVVLAATPAGEVYETTDGDAWTLVARAGVRLDALTKVGGQLIASASSAGVLEARGDGVRCAGAGRKVPTLGLAPLGEGEVLRLSRSRTEVTAGLVRVSVRPGRRSCPAP